jgi:hypothetical protein
MTNAWQRRYEESLARQRAAPGQAGDLSAGEVAAIESTGCLPGWEGLAALAVTGGLVLIRRRWRRRRSRRC